MPRRTSESSPELSALFDNSRRHNREGLLTRSDSRLGLRRQQFIFRQGDPAQSMYLLLEGRVMLVRDYEAEDDARAAFLATAPSLLGEPISTNESLTHGFSAKPFEPTKILVIQRKHLGKYLYEDPDITRAMNLAVNNDFNALTQRIIALSGRSVDQNIAATSLDVSQRGELVLGGTLEELAMLAGTTKATVSKFLSEWERQGILERKRLGFPNPLKYRIITETGLTVLEMVSEGHNWRDALRRQQITSKL
jgi:CRP-like cAMP-binding protein